MSTNAWYVLTGGPCAGKTTLINALQAKGYRTVPEAARAHIEHGLAQGKTIEEIRADEIAFQREVLRLKVAIEQTLPADEHIFFDRGMHDSVAYFDIHGAGNDAELLAAVAAATYRKVFLLDIISYMPDGIRTETVEKAQRIHERLGSVYIDSNIPVVRVPVLSVEERVAFVLNHL